MGAVCLAMLMILAGRCGAEATDSEEHEMVERINQRYDDFFHRTREIAEQDLQREKAANEIKAQREATERAQREAQAAFVKARKVEVPDPAREREWDAEQRDWKEQNNLARKRYVERRQHLDTIERKGRMIPSLQEYDLEID